MEILTITQSRCKSCGYCVAACPKQALSLTGVINGKGYAAVEVNRALCICCGICYTVCPDYVFAIQEET